MKTFFASILFVAGVLAQNFTVNTPANAVECQPTLINWSGGTAPYYPRNSIYPGATPNAPAIVTLPTTSSTSLTWIVNVAANTNIGITIRDSTGQIAQSASFIVQAGSSMSCLNTTSASAGPTGTSGGASASGSSGASGTSGTTSPSTTAKGGASANVARFGAAGVVGAAVAALLI